MGLWPLTDGFFNNWRLAARVLKFTLLWVLEALSSITLTK